MKSETGKGIIPKPRVAGNMFGREDAIRSLRCISEAAGGCEREIDVAEYAQWDTPTRAEYGQSGCCSDCQDKIFFGPDDDAEYDLYDEDGPDFNYDPDMREDDPPHDLHLIRWPVGVL